jgi:hypothetical protein
MTNRPDGAGAAATTAAPPPVTEAASARRAAAPGACAADQDAETLCPACGDTLRLWANYHRCRTCGYKESCCF